MLTPLIVAGVVLTSAVMLVKHLQDRKALHASVWPLLLVASALPILSARTVLDPGLPVDSATIHKAHDKVSLDVPPGHSLMVTATFTEFDETDENERTSYALALKGAGWAENASGTMKRANAHKGPDVPTDDHEGISEAGKVRSGGLGQDVQDRFDLPGAGAMEVEVLNWQGTAAAELLLEVVKSPLDERILWGMAVLLAAAGLVAEAKLDTDRIGGDLTFLALWAVFIREGVTPKDDWQELAKAVVPAALLGWGAIGGVSYLMHKVLSAKVPEGEPAPAPAPAPPAPAATPEPAAEAPAEGGEADGARTGTTRRRRK